MAINLPELVKRIEKLESAPAPTPEVTKAQYDKVVADLKAEVAAETATKTDVTGLTTRTAAIEKVLKDQGLTDAPK